MTAPISVLIQYYQHGEFIESCLESIYSGHSVPLDVWLHDDGSNDDSLYLLQKLQQKYGFRLTHSENQGLIGVLNEMVPKAQGEFVVLQAGDDLWTPNKLPFQLNWMQHNSQASVCCGSTPMVDNQGLPLSAASQMFIHHEDTVINFSEIFCGQKAIPAASAMFRTQDLQKLFPLPQNLEAEDFYIFLKLCEHGQSVYLHSQELAQYRIHDNNLHHQKERINFDLLRTLKYFRIHPDYSKAQRRWRGAIFSELALENPRKALKFWLKRPLFTSDVFKGMLKLFIPQKLWHKYKRI